MLTFQEAGRAVRAYNGVPRNMVLDSRLLELFAPGLGLNVADISEQLYFIGYDYGGVWAGIRATAVPQIAPAIAQGIAERRTEFVDSLSAVSCIESGGPQLDHIESLFEFFRGHRYLPRRGPANWIVWGTKVWHALRPDAFPILDSRAENYLRDCHGLQKQDELVPRYLGFCNKVFEVLPSWTGWIEDLRAIDREAECPAWSDLKLWDKVFYTMGKKRRRGTEVIRGRETKDVGDREPGAVRHTILPHGPSDHLGGRSEL